MDRPPFNPLQARTRDGREFVVREATLADAPAMIDYIRAYVREEDVHTPMSAGECDFTIQEEVQFIRSHQGENSLLLLALADDGEILSVLNFTGGRYRRNRHAGMWGISVARPWRGRGVGTVVLEQLIDWCRRHPYICRLEMEVFANNAGAIQLYERLGFSEEGRRRRAYHWHGEPVDCVMMALLLDKPVG